MSLTIAIPTYNRNTILKNNLSFLLPQINPECKILILDNSSDIPVIDSINDLLKNYPEIDIKVVRNKYNIGLTGNILRCFELCETPWLWILGDDDQVKDGALTQISNDIKKYNDEHFISYAWDEPSFKRNKDIITKGIDDLIDSFESIGVILFISTSIYNVTKMSNKMSYGNFFQTTYAPHLVILFMSLKDNGKCVLSCNQIVINKSEETPISLKWDQIFIYQIVLLMRLPLHPTSIYKLKSRLKELTRLWTLPHLIYTLVFLKYDKNDARRPLELYDDIVHSFFYLDKRIISKIIKYFGYLIIKYPILFRPILKFIYKLLKSKEFQPNNNLRI
jgi:glycosyltransferase involved in cell wall biosynthesis